MLEESLIGNIKQIETRVSDACLRSQRDRKDITVVCVSKSVGILETQQVINLSITDLAENRVEQLLDKKNQLKNCDHVKWHFIGNLQRRKVKTVINDVDYFHALDTLKLAQEIQKRADKQICCFIQVNVSGEESKQGISPDELNEFVDLLSEYDKIKIVGLMTMAPINATELELRHYFSTMKMLQSTIESKQLDYAPCHELSMGMSRDYSEAIESGATYVRIGSSFFN